MKLQKEKEEEIKRDWGSEVKKERVGLTKVAAKGGELRVGK